MTAEWSEVLERLVPLQRLDAKARRLKAELDRAPAEMASREKAIAAVDAKMKALQDRVKILRAQILLRENEFKTHAAKIAKLKTQASEVRTNKEFVAFRSEIANCQGECDRLEGEVLKILEVVEQAEERVRELEAERAHAVEARDKVRAAADDRLGSVRERLEALQAERPTLLAGIPKEALEIYERIHRARGEAMAPLDGAYCAACGDRQTRNEAYAVQNRTRLVQCGGCNRILYQL